MIMSGRCAGEEQASWNQRGVEVSSDLTWFVVGVRRYLRDEELESEQLGGSRVRRRKGKRRGSAGILIGVGMWQIEQQIDGIEGGEKIAHELAHMREIRLEVRGDDLAWQLGPACQWKGEKREGTSLVLIARLRLVSLLGRKECPEALFYFFLLFFFLFFRFLIISYLFDLCFNLIQTSL
jgi:hypothetical protein